MNFRYSLGEEIANAITHGIGALLSVPALIILVIQAALKGTTLHIVSFSIFGVSMFLLYLFSTLTHSITNERAKKVMEFFDHSAIYVLIAGTYTPFIAIALDGRIKYGLLGLVWGLAVAGIIFKIFFLDKFHFVSTILYLVMGWLIVFFIKPVYALLEGPGFVLLVAGGIFYSLGCVFYLWRLFPYHHMVWHLFVLAGSVCMYLCVLLYLI